MSESVQPRSLRGNTEGYGEQKCRFWEEIIIWVPRMGAGAEGWSVGIQCRMSEVMATEPGCTAGEGSRREHTGDYESS